MFHRNWAKGTGNIESGDEKTQETPVSCPQVSKALSWRGNDLVLFDFRGQNKEKTGKGRGETEFGSMLGEASS